MKNNKEDIIEKILSEIEHMVDNDSIRNEYHNIKVNDVLSSIELIELIVQIEKIYEIDLYQNNLSNITVESLSDMIILELENKKESNKYINEIKQQIFGDDTDA